MPRVPRTTDPGTSVGAIPAPARTVPQTGGQQGAASLRAPAQSLQKLGDLIAEGGRKIRNRQDAVARSKAPRTCKANCSSGNFL